jgi:hypothetical protein
MNALETIIMMTMAFFIPALVVFIVLKEFVW